MATSARGQRQQRIVAVLHAEGVIGATVAEIARATTLEPGQVKAVISSLKTRREVVLLAARRNPEDNKLEEVWGCRCPRNHMPEPDDIAPSWNEPVRLDDETRALGLQRIAETRALLEQSTDRRVS